MNQDNNTFLHTLKDNLLMMKELINKKIEQQESYLNNKDGKLEDLLKTAQANILVNQLKKDVIEDTDINDKLKEIERLSSELRDKIK
jgi:hypothetical protein